MERLTGTIPHFLLSFLAALCFVASSRVANASEIGPGLDAFRTLSGSEVDLSFLLPSVGVIDLEGVPFGASGVDTIVARQ